MKKIMVLTHFIQSSIKTKLIFAVIGIAIVSIGTVTYSTNGSSNSGYIGKDNILVSSKEKIKENTNSPNNISAADKGGEIEEEEKPSSPLNLEIPTTSPVVNPPVVKATTPVETLSDIREQVIEKHTGVVKAPVKAQVKVPVVKAPIKAQVKAPVKAQVKAPVVQDYNQVTLILALREHDFNVGYNADTSITAFNTTNISGDLVRLMKETHNFLDTGELTTNDARNIWVDKYVGGKYKVKALNYFSVDVPDKEPLQTWDEFYALVKAKGLMKYTSSTSSKFDNYNSVEHLNDRSIYTCTRLVIELNID